MAVQAVRATRPELLTQRTVQWGVVFAILSGVSAAGFAALLAYGSSLPSGQMFYAGLRLDQLMLIALTVSGPSAAIGLLLLVPPLVGLIPLGWVRAVSGTLIFLAALAALAAAALWAIYFVLALIGGVAFSSSKVSAADGQSVIVAQEGVRNHGYRIYRQHSPFIYRSSLSGDSEDGEFPTQHCALAPQGADLVLSCGNHTIRVPPVPE